MKRPAIHVNNTKHNNQSNTYKYTDYSYLRLKNVEISYTLPRRWLSKASISNCTIYASGNNLITWWDGDDRVDPETGEANNYPIVRSYTIGVKLSF